MGLSVRLITTRSRSLHSWTSPCAAEPKRISFSGSYSRMSTSTIRWSSCSRRSPRSSTTGSIPLRLFDERQGLDGGSLALAVDLDGQACAGWREVAQRKTESDDLAERRRADRARDPAHFAVAAEEFGSWRGNLSILQDEAHQPPPHRAVGVHASDHFLSRVAALGQAEGLALQIGFRRDDVLIQIRTGVGEARLHAQALQGVRAEGPQSKRLTVRPAAVPRCLESVGWLEDCHVGVAGLLGADQDACMAVDVHRHERERLEGGWFSPERRVDELRRLGAADQEQPPGLGAVLHHGLCAEQQVLADRRMGDLPDLIHVLKHQGLAELVHPEVGDHFSLVREEARVNSLSRSQGKDIVADDAL